VENADDEAKNGVIRGDSCERKIKRDSNLRLIQGKSRVIRREERCQGSQKPKGGRQEPPATEEGKKMIAFTLGRAKQGAQHAQTNVPTGLNRMPGRGFALGGNRPLVRMTTPGVD